MTATKLFGEISKTPCMALGACSTDIMEKYIKLFMSNGRESPMKVVYADSMDGEDAEVAAEKQKAEFKLKPPGLLEDTARRERRAQECGRHHSSVSVSITFRIHCSL